jgi:hypothetical protein
LSPSLRRFLAISGPVGLLAVGGCGRIGYEPLGPPLTNDAERAESGLPAQAASGGTDAGGAIGDATIAGDGGDAPSALTDGGGADGTGMANAVPDTGTADAASDGSGEGCVVTNGGVEICDGLDNDCDGVVDNGGVCGAGCTGATYGGHVYASCTTPVPFSGAATDCASKSMRLVRVDDAAENQFLYSIAFANPANLSNAFWPWIGGSDIATPVEWMWADGTVFWTGRNNGSAVGGLYTNWAAAAPTDASGTYCTAMQRGGNGTWVDRGCANVQPYFCEGY